MTTKGARHDADDSRCDDEHDHHRDQDGWVVEQTTLATHVPWRPGVVGAGSGGHLHHPERQPGPHHHPARQLPGPGHLRRLCLRSRRPSRHRPADPHRLRLRRRAGRAWRLTPGSRVPQPTVHPDLPRRRADRGGGQAGRSVTAGPPPAPLHHARRDRPWRRGRLRLRRPRKRRLRLHRPVHQQWPVADQCGRDRGAARHPGPVGHGLWTAILGGALFATAARRGRLRLTGSVLGFYLLVAALHALWDASQPIAVWLTLLLTGTQVQSQLLRMGQVPAVTQTQVHLFTFLSWGLLIVDALIGLWALRGRWRKATALEQPATSNTVPPVASETGQP